MEDKQVGLHYNQPSNYSVQYFIDEKQLEEQYNFHMQYDALVTPEILGKIEEIAYKSQGYDINENNDQYNNAVGVDSISENLYSYENFEDLPVLNREQKQLNLDFSKDKGHSIIIKFLNEIDMCKFEDDVLDLIIIK